MCRLSGLESVAETADVHGSIHDSGVLDDEVSVAVRPSSLRHVEDALVERVQLAVTDEDRRLSP